MFQRFSWYLFLFIFTNLLSNSASAVNFKIYNSTFSLNVKKSSGSTFICSSVAINPQTLLTAAHCLEEAQAIEVTDGQIKRVATSWDEHPQYNKLESKYYADIGIITLSENLPRYINYPDLAYPLPYHSLTRIGFGGRQGKNVRTLVSGIWITETLDTSLILKDELGVPGDSGGPLFQFINGKLCLVAIHSTVEGKKSYAPIVRSLVIESFY